MRKRNEAGKNHRVTVNTIFKKGKGIMATNPIGKGTKTIGINMDAKLVDELEQRARSMHISLSKYCKIVLIRWADSGKKLRLEER